MRNHGKAGPTVPVPGRVDIRDVVLIEGRKAALAGEIAVECNTPGQFRVKNRDQHVGRFRHGNVVIHLKQDLNTGSRLFYFRSPDEDERDSALSDLVNNCLGGKAVELAPETVAFDFNVDQAEVGRFMDNGFRQKDRTRAGSPYLHSIPEVISDRILKIKDADEAGNAGALATGDNQPGKVAEIGGFDPPAWRADAFEMVAVLMDISLKIQDADNRSRGACACFVVTLPGSHFGCLPAPSGEPLPFGNFRDFKSGHGLAEPDRSLQNLLRFFEIRRCLDNRPGPQGRVCRLEDS